ncbi:MAG: hypothetical protein IPP20_06135 [Gemmatimonadetes bacterium]|nr:hypothetical protein [Gemmatimonadota bacterium]
MTWLVASQKETQSGSVEHPVKVRRDRGPRERWREHGGLRGARRQVNDRLIFPTNDRLKFPTS